MYRLPNINASVPTCELDLPVGNGQGLMYKLPKIQGSLSNGAQSDVLIQLEARQGEILKQLEDLKTRVESLKEKSTSNKNEPDMLDIVIHCSYHAPPLSVPIACRLLQEQSGLKVFTSCHVHSNVKNDVGQLRDFLPSSNCKSRMDANLRITVIWKEDVRRDPDCFVTLLPNHKIKGEVNLLRFLSRNFGLLRNTSVRDAPTTESKSDEWLDRIHSNIIWRDMKSSGQKSKVDGFLKDIEKVVSVQEFLVEDKNPGIVDLLAYTSILEAIGSQTKSNPMKKYMNTCKTYFEPRNEKIRPVGVVN